jgi:hypothetical protein
MEASPELESSVFLPHADTHVMMGKFGSWTSDADAEKGQPFLWVARLLISLFFQEIFDSPSYIESL